MFSNNDSCTNLFHQLSKVCLAALNYVPKGGDKLLMGLQVTFHSLPLLCQREHCQPKIWNKSTMRETKATYKLLWTVKAYYSLYQKVSINKTMSSIRKLKKYSCPMKSLLLLAPKTNHSFNLITTKNRYIFFHFRSMDLYRTAIHFVYNNVLNYFNKWISEISGIWSMSIQ